MSQAFHDFLVWFDGWSENIDEQPTAKQWDRLKARLTETRGASPAPTAAAFAASDSPISAEPIVERVRPAKTVKPVNPVISWTAKFKGELINLGYDPESAAEMMPKNVDVNTDPIAMARSAAEGARMN